MRLQGEGGVVIELSPDGGLVRGRVRCERGEWQFLDSCLEVGELVELARWLRRVGGGRSPKGRLEFMEPNLAFEVLESEGATRRIRTWFDWESAPPWHDERPGYPVIVGTDAESLIEAGEQLRGEIPGFG